MSQQLSYIDRETGKRLEENIYGKAELQWLYHSRTGRLFRPLIARSWFSELSAIRKRVWRSQSAVAHFAKTYGVNLNEAEKPVDQYRNLDDFFSRKLRQGIRPLCKQGNALSSPADGRALAYRITRSSKLNIKGQSIDIDTLLDKKVNDELIGGQALVVRLAPKDYHRFHFPADGIASAYKVLPGPLESVHPIALDAGAGSFLNKRTVLQLDTDQFGRIYIIAVGALTIGTIVHNYRPGEVCRGNECGYFRFGGSTVIMLWGREGPDIDEDIQANTKAGFETLVKYGSRIAYKNNGLTETNTK